MTCVETGLDMPPVGVLPAWARGSRAGPSIHLRDGVADIDLGRLIAFHGSHQSLATMTVVQPVLPFGVAQLNGNGWVEGFREKPRSEHWINGGFSLRAGGA